MRAKRIIPVAAALLIALALAACASDTPAGSGDPTPSGSPTVSPPATPVTHTEDDWTIETPAGWVRTDITKDADATKAIRYAGPDGRFVIVAINPQGSDYASDAVWRYQVAGNGFEIVDKTDCTSGEQCSTTDQRYDGYVFAEGSGEPPKVGGNSYYFIFGDTDTATVDAAEFETIIESVEAK